MTCNGDNKYYDNKSIVVKTNQHVHSKNSGELARMALDIGFPLWGGS